MRVAVVSDVHANLVALDAVLKDAGEVDAIWCLGDSVGYGPQPLEVLERLAGAVSVLGNHDAAAAGVIGTESFNPFAAAAAEWTSSQMTEECVERIRAMPEVERQEGFSLVHGTLRWPIWEYLLDEDSARAHLALQETTFGLVGHTHIPVLVSEEPGDRISFRVLKDGDHVPLGDQRIVLNPGSVGQPRDGDPRASYGVVDTAAAGFTLHRVPYDIAATQRLMAEAGLPQRLIDRLEVGR